MMDMYLFVKRKDLSLEALYFVVLFIKIIFQFNSCDFKILFILYSFILFYFCIRARAGSFKFWPPWIIHTYYIRGLTSDGGLARNQRTAQHSHNKPSPCQPPKGKIMWNRIGLSFQKIIWLWNRTWFQISFADFELKTHPKFSRS